MIRWYHVSFSAKQPAILQFLQDQMKMQHAVMRIIELYGSVGHRDGSEASLNAELAVALAAEQLAEAEAEELHEAGADRDRKNV